MAENKSFISSHINVYSMINDDIKNDAISDTFTLINPTENDKYFEWIHIPIDEDKYHTYKVDELCKYMSSYENIPDPYRCYEKINFMKTRLNRYKEILDSGENITIKEVTDDLRTCVLKSILKSFYDNERITKTFNLAVIINIKTLFYNNMVLNIDIDSAYNLLLKKPVGSFIIRNSSCSSLIGDFSIFSMSYKTKLVNNGNITCSIKNRRFINIHGVGLYDANGSDKKYYENLTKNKFLKDVDYKEAEYVCIMDIIVDMHIQGLININHMILND
jgi:hypothetical protein